MSETRHEPSAEFRAFLEWQVASTVRRQQRFAEPVHRRRFPLHTAVIAIVSIALGAAAAVASAQVQDARDRNVLIEVARNDMAMAELRMQLVRQAYDHARAAFARGIASRETLVKAEAELREMENRIARLRLNISEIEATGQSPRDEIAAPAVNGRDFVTQRLQLDLEVAESRLAGAEEAVRLTERRVAVGMAHRLALVEAQVELARVKSELAQLMSTIDVRKQFLTGQLQPAQANTTLERVRLTREVEVLRLQMELQTDRLKLLQEQQRVGAVSDVEVLRAQLDVSERELEIASLQARLNALKRLP